jgi:hypothetical protein
VPDLPEQAKVRPSSLSIGGRPRLPEWKHSSRWFASNFITLGSFAIPVGVLLL